MDLSTGLGLFAGGVVLVTLILMGGELGMFVDVQVGERTARPVVLIPASALQPSGAESVVYVATPGSPGRFVERPVRIGEPVHGQVAVEIGRAHV